MFIYNWSLTRALNENILTMLQLRVFQKFHIYTTHIIQIIKNTTNIHFFLWFFCSLFRRYWDYITTHKEISCLSKHEYSIDKILTVNDPNSYCSYFIISWLCLLKHKKSDVILHRMNTIAWCYISHKLLS